ncbi:recombinase family protein [Streptomyces sp. NPDC017979]|uniref:recombinase family protein n=1 Tax=Streptomyces sp. NPDC017979 TaxID=3365024 RepID=UPI0037BDA262
MKLATTSPERQRTDVLTAAASIGGHIIGWVDDWEVSGATDPMTRPKFGPWLRDERGPYDGLVAAAVDRLGRNVVDCLNTGYKMRDSGALVTTVRHGRGEQLSDARPARVRHCCRTHIAWLRNWLAEGLRVGPGCGYAPYLGRSRVARSDPPLCHARPALSQTRRQPPAHVPT